MTATDTPSFGLLLWQWRRAAALTQEELAERAGMSVETISVLERGISRSPYRATITSLADALGLDQEDRARLLAAARAERAAPVPVVASNRSVPAHGRDAEDGVFRGQLLRLRGRSGLTQRALGALVGIGEHAIQQWEAGRRYPSPARLQALIAVYRQRGVFLADDEAAEARALWEALRREANQRIPPFDVAWFAALHPRTASPDAAPLAGAAIPAAPAPIDPAAGRWEPPPVARPDWGEAPDVAAFQGRAAELATLGRWLLGERCRVVALLGLGGIGKTSLATRLAQDLAPGFEGLCWRSLRNAPPPEEWLGAAITALAPIPLLLPAGLPARLGLLLGLLRERRYLLVLDNLETVLAPGAAVARYRDGYEGYGEVLRQVGESSHQSALLLTAREPPPELAVWEGEVAPVRVLRLGGLDAAAGRALLQHKGLVGDEAAWQRLIERYGGNPLALKVVGQTIVEVFGGAIGPFLTYATEPSDVVFGGLRRLLDEQVARLSPLSQALLSWLTIEREPVGFAELAADLGPEVPGGELVEAVEALVRRSLLERGAGGTVTLQPVVLEYATTRLVAQVAEEVLTGEPALLVRQPLLKAQAKDYLRRSQERLIVQPLLERLVGSLGSVTAVERRLLGLLEAWRGRPAEEQVYGPGNVVNLLRLLRGDLHGLDLSRLAIRQAYLQGVEAQDASLAGAHLAAVALSEAFSYTTALALSADGTFLAMGTATGEVWLRRVTDRTLLLGVQGHGGPVLGVALSADGRLLASGSFDGTVKLWEAGSGQPLATLRGHSRGVWGVALSADGHLLASGSVDGTVKVWDVNGGQVLTALQGHQGGVQGVALSGDGHVVASGSFDGTVKLWEVATGRLLRTLEGHTGTVQGVSLSGDGRFVASGSGDGTARVWEVASGRLLAIMPGHTGAVHTVALSTNGQVLASGSGDGTVKIWEADPQAGTPGRLVATLKGHTHAVESVALAGNGRVLASGSDDGTVTLWEVASGRQVATLKGRSDGIWSVALSADGRLLTSGSFDGTVKLWEPETGRLLAILHEHTGGVLAVTLSADRRLLASGSLDGTVKLWEPETGRLLATLQGHTSGVHTVAVTPDGRRLASGSGDGTVKLWDIPTGKVLATLRGHTSSVQAVALSADGRLLASGSQDGTVKLWEAGNGHLMSTLREHASGVWAVALSADGCLLASGSQDGTVKLWDVPAGGLLVALEGHTGSVQGLALAADGRLLVCGGWDGALTLWEIPAGRLLATLQGHTAAVRGVALSGDGHVLASGSYDGTLRVWETGTGSVLRTMRVDRSYERMDITGLTGVTAAQQVALLALGVIDRSRDQPVQPTLGKDVSSPASAANPLAPAPPAGALLPALARPPSNLPPPRTTFVGRTADVATLRQALDPTGTGPRLLTLTGGAGSGKTRLALAVAERVLGTYQDGIALVELAPLSASLDADPTRVVVAALAALGLREEPGRAVLDTMVAHLRTRRLLLLLDNCEHLVAACAALTEALLAGCPELHILATSQVPLGIADETIRPVGTLALPPQWEGAATPQVLQQLGQSDAVQLFVERAQAVRPGFALSAANATAVAAICRQLDGLPLAIELAAARMHMLPLDEVLARLDDRFRLLRRGGRTPIDRHQALQATLDWSYGLLDPAEQALLRRLAVFAGGWEVTAAEAVCAGEEVEAKTVLQLLDALQDRSLVYVDVADGAPRYGMLETVRQYGLLRLERAGELAVMQDRHLLWCMALAGQAAPLLQGPEQDVWLARLEREHDNLRAALRWSLGAGASSSTALSLASSLVRYWIMHAHFSEGRRWLGEALAAEAGTAAERAGALGGAGLLAEGQSAYEEATRLLDESLELWQALGDQAGAARALANQGLVAGWQGDFGRARGLLEEALAIFRTLHAQDDMAETLATLGLFVEVQGDASLAWALLEEALSVFRAVGDGRGVAHALGWMALTARRHGAYARALTLYEEALAHARAVGDQRSIARWLNGVALSLASQGEYERAQVLLEESLALSRAQGDVRNTAASFNDLGEIARKQGAYGRARSLFEESQALQRQLGDGWGIANTHRNLADVAEREGDTERAAHLLVQSLAGFQEVGDRWGVAYCLELGGRVAAARGRWAEATQLLAGAVALRETIGTQLEPDELDVHEQLLRTVTRALGEERFTVLWAGGRARPRDDLLAMFATAIGTTAVAATGEGPTSRA